jgi:hypothetical protein
VAAASSFITTEKLLGLGLLPDQAGEPPDPRARLAFAFDGEAREFEVEIAALPVAAPGETQRWRLGLQPDGPSFDLARRPFHRSPGRWYLCCPICGRWRAALALVFPGGVEPSSEAPRSLTGAIWVCRACLGLPPPAQRLSASQRVFRAIERAEYANHRQPGERLDRWLRRQTNASKVKAKATTKLSG